MQCVCVVVRLRSVNYLITIRDDWIVLPLSDGCEHKQYGFTLITNKYTFTAHLLEAMHGRSHAPTHVRFPSGCYGDGLFCDLFERIHTHKHTHAHTDTRALAANFYVFATSVAPKYHHGFIFIFLSFQ